MNSRAYLNLANYDSIDLYLPFVGSALALSYAFKRRKNWLSILIFTCILFMFIPILNSSFFLFTTKYYARWFYMPSLILSLLSIKCIEENLSIKAGIITSFLSLLVMVLMTKLMFLKILWFYILFPMIRNGKHLLMNPKLKLKKLIIV